jgi:thymidine kinase
MFIEPNIKGDRKGWIEVICGSMFSGKTEELIRRLKRVKIANLKVEIFKPAIDVRYDEVKIVSHDTNSIHSTPVENAHAILLMTEGVDVVGIDEAQFFDAEIAFVCEQLALKDITKLHAICMKCGGMASISYRKIATGGQVLLGEKDVYEARCRECAQEGV